MKPDLSDLPTVDQQAASRRGPLVKGPMRTTLKAQAEIAELAVIREVREACLARDGRCRIAAALSGYVIGYGDIQKAGVATACEGRAEWAHMHSHRRSLTKGQEPRRRHGTIFTLMLCRRHHDHYDGRRRPRMNIKTLNPRQGADGRLKFTVKREGR